MSKTKGFRDYSDDFADDKYGDPPATPLPAVSPGAEEPREVDDGFFEGPDEPHYADANRPRTVRGGSPTSERP